MARKTFLAVLLAVFFFYSENLLATDYSSLNFTVKDPVINIGADFSTSSNFQLWSSFGQQAIGISTTTDFTIKSGFLYFPIPIISGTSAPPAPQIIPIQIVGGGLVEIPLVSLKKGGLICDFNNDNVCNIIDFSILLVYYGKPVDYSVSRYDLNNDKTIGLIDVSILFYYWV